MTDEPYEEGYDSPEEAARGDIPERYARALSVSVSPDGGEAIVVLGTNEEPYLYPYEVNCSRMGDRWFEGSGSNGLGVGWSPRQRRGGEMLGVVRLSGEVHTQVREVIVAWNGGEHRCEVSSGYFFFTEWDVPQNFLDILGWPRVARHVLNDGSEKPVEPDPSLEHVWGWMPEEVARARSRTAMTSTGSVPGRRLSC